MSESSDKVLTPPAEMPQVVENLFRREWGKIVATLTRIFGVERLELAQDVVQEALVRALQTWPYYGVPENPAAWIMRVARNLALDQARRETRFRNKEKEIAGFLEQHTPSDSAVSNEINDDCLRMMFVCCHPQIPREAQVALALRTLCGFSVAEIASAFLTSEAAIAKRLTRAKQRIRAARIAFEIPAGEELAARLNGVLQTLYLLFNEGYKASVGQRLIRKELCREAIRLTELLAGHAAGDRPRSHALLALMFLNAARLSTRTDGEGNILRLKEQDRSRWDQPMIARGMFHLAQSASGLEISEYHLQAGIAACHCVARNFEDTDWPQILSLYDRLVEQDDSPVVALNRAVAVANTRGTAAGIAAIKSIRNCKELKSYYLLYAVLGEFEARLGRPRSAASYFRQALEQTEITSEQQFLSKRVRECETASLSGSLA
ncbi:MAG TPA: sigma-70 family RNA polymerase sigma factor [Terrimicrobiaceae bacterium]